MATREIRRFTSRRVAALVLIGLVLVGLGYLRLAGRSSTLTVPAGAKAGELRDLKPCAYRAAAGTYQADCGTLVVPETRTAPGSRLIALPVVRVRARSSSGAAPLFWLQGGPGQSNMLFQEASRFIDGRDVVLVGYRGVDGSVRLDCPEVASALKHSARYLSADSYRRYGDGYRACARRLAADGVDVTAYSLAQQVEDLEAARQALGYDRVDLMSESAGTRTALIYAWRHPSSIHRSVMLGVNPPGRFLESPEITDELIGRYAQLCAQDDGCRARTPDLAASLRQASTNIPGRWWFLPIKRSNARITAFYGLMESSSDALGGPSTIDALLSANEGDPSGLWFASVLSDLLYPNLFAWGQYAAGAGLDDAASQRYFTAWGPEQAANLGYAATAFAWGGGDMADAWPAPFDAGDYSTVPVSNTETLLISGALDFATPPQTAANELVPALPNGHQVALDGFGHVGSFWNQQPEAGTRLITAFLDRGEVDQSLYVPQRVDFSPTLTMARVAKAVLAIVVLLALLTLGSLAWMARRVHRRGPYGPVASALLRSLHPVILGLGGWSIGALLALTFLARVTLDNRLLIVVAVGLPVGLGVFLAWAPRDWLAPGGWPRLAAAVLAALLGAWIGVAVTSTILGVITAVGGAIAVANLALIVADLSRARPASGWLPATPPAPGPPAHQEQEKATPATVSRVAQGWTCPAPLPDAGRGKRPADTGAAT